MEEIILEEKIAELVAEKKFHEIKAIFSEMAAADIAPLFDALPESAEPIVYRLLPKELASEVFVEMDFDMQERLIISFGERELKEVLDDLYLDDTVDIIEEMPANVVKKILKVCSAEQRKSINELLKYPKDSAGSIMTPEFVDLKKEMTVADAFDRIRKTGVDKETVYTCYVTGKSRKLRGVITVRELLLADKEDKIGDIMTENVIFANTHDDKEEVAALFSKYDFLAIPIVDNEERLVGIVTVDDAMDVIEEASTEDMEILAGITPGDKPYLKSSVFEIIKARIPWLLLLMLSATFTGIIIASFESKLTVFPALIGFIPMLMGTGGNSGSQSSVTVIRSLSLGEIDFSDTFAVIWKELRISVICALVLSAVGYAKIYFIDKLLLHNVDRMGEITVISITLAFTVIFAKLIGCVMPILAKKVGADPAVMASPFITTVVDAFTLVIYFAVASLVLNI